ncbi:hypothetical protein Tco_0937973 [Tanacetum coccineum]|uniref:ATP synthase subunit a n=1 Tax=Tanacetum coccineum TaxID=301880 RepID=A0ABQ5DGR5_9ASTR
MEEITGRWYVLILICGWEEASMKEVNGYVFHPPQTCRHSFCLDNNTGALVCGLDYLHNYRVRPVNPCALEVCINFLSWPGLWCCNCFIVTILKIPILLWISVGPANLSVAFGLVKLMLHIPLFALLEECHEVFNISLSAQLGLTILVLHIPVFGIVFGITGLVLVLVFGSVTEFSILMMIMLLSVMSTCLAAFTYCLVEHG